VPRSRTNGESSHLASTTHARRAGAQAHPHQPQQQMCVADESVKSAVANVPQRRGHNQLSAPLRGVCVRHSQLQHKL